MSIQSSIPILISIFVLLSSSAISLPVPVDQVKENEGTTTIEFNVATEQELLITSVEIGSPKQKVNLVIDLGAERTWISDSIFNKKDSTTFATNSFTDHQFQDFFSYSGFICNDEIKVGEKVLKNFQFLWVNKIESNKLFQGALSWGREFDTKKFSLAYRLSATSATFYNSFILKFENNKGILHIGNWTKEIKEDRSFLSTCTILASNPKIKWACMLTHVFIGDVGSNTFHDNYTRQDGYIIEDQPSSKINVIDQPVHFETIYNKIYAPEKFMDYLKENIFTDKINKKAICAYNTDNKHKKHFVCSRDVIESIQKINFVLSGRLALSFRSDTLFQCEENKCEFLIVNKEALEDVWVFGLPV